MLYYDRVEVSEGIGFNICHFWYFLYKRFKFQLDACDGCHDILVIYRNLSDIAILNIYGVDYLCIISEIRRNETINLLQNSDLTETLCSIIFLYCVKKMGKEIITLVTLKSKNINFIIAKI